MFRTRLFETGTVTPAKGQEDVELKDMTTVTGCTFDLEGLIEPHDAVDCTFQLSNEKTIEAQIVVGDHGAFQVRFNNGPDAQKALDWVKSSVAPILPDDERDTLKKRANVTPPSNRGDKFIFRLMGKNQIAAMQSTAPVSDTKPHK